MDTKRIAIVAGALLAVAGCVQPNEPPRSYPVSWRPAPAVIGGYGQGYGPMYGPAMSIQGRYGLHALNLSAEQRDRIAAIDTDLRARQQPLVTRMHEVMAADAEPFDEQADRAEFDQLAGLQKQMFENAVAAQRDIFSVLTPQQRDEVRRGWRVSR